MKNFKEEVSKPHFVALYGHLELNFVSVNEVRYVNYDEHYAPLPEGQTREMPCNGYVRLTEPVEVRFTAIDNDALVRNAVESLNEQERKVVEELNEKLAQIRERKNQLLALTHQPEQS